MLRVLYPAEQCNKLTDFQRDDKIIIRPQKKAFADCFKISSFADYGNSPAEILLFYSLQK